MASFSADKCKIIGMCQGAKKTLEGFAMKDHLIWDNLMYCGVVARIMLAFTTGVVVSNDASDKYLPDLHDAMTEIESIDKSEVVVMMYTVKGLKGLVYSDHCATAIFHGDHVHVLQADYELAVHAPFDEIMGYTRFERKSFVGACKALSNRAVWCEVALKQYAFLRQNASYQTMEPMTFQMVRSSVKVIKMGSVDAMIKQARGRMADRTVLDQVLV